MTTPDDTRERLRKIIVDAYGYEAAMDPPTVTDAVLAALRDSGWVDPEEAKRRKNERIVSVVFGHHRGAPRPFALRRKEDVSGVSGTGVVALGVEWPDGLVVLRWTSDWPTSVVFHDRGMESVEAVHGHGGKTEVVWLSDELEPRAAMEQEVDQLRAAVSTLAKENDQLGAVAEAAVAWRDADYSDDAAHNRLVAAVDSWERVPRDKPEVV